MDGEVSPSISNYNNIIIANPAQVKTDETAIKKTNSSMEPYVCFLKTLFRINPPGIPGIRNNPIPILVILFKI